MINAGRLLRMRRSIFKVTAHAKFPGPVQESNIYRRYLHGDTAKSPKITFFDISSALSPQAWSPSTWKARLVLNYKEIPYRTNWVAYPDIEATLMKYGGKGTGKHPDDPSKPYYTFPALLDESGEQSEFITDSLLITEYLDKKYPQRPVFPKQGKALIYAFEDCWTRATRAFIAPIIRPTTPLILDERGREYYVNTRERWFGKIAETSPPGPVRDAHWQGLHGGLGKIANILDHNGPGVAFAAGGSGPTRADFIMAATLLCLRAVLGNEWQERGIEKWHDGRWGKLLKDTQDWQHVR